MDHPLRSRLPTEVATEVFPNPGEPQMETIRVLPEVMWSMISSHSFWRPAKCGTVGGRYDLIMSSVPIKD